MFVRMLTGAYSGEVREVKYTVGETLVRDKRAARVDFDPASPSPPPPAEIAITPDVTRAVTPDLAPPITPPVTQAAPRASAPAKPTKSRRKR